MAEERMAHNESCANDMHNEHLCFLMCEGFHYKNKDAYKEMVQDAHYRCQNCGRTSKSEKNLCEPIAL
ncbi:hypothetical protein ACFL5Z_04040 [Planctomycetota bacterium]